MAYVNTTLNSSSTHLLARIKTAIADFGTTMSQRRVYRATVEELSRLSSRELADLGIHRSQIGAVALEAAYGK